MHLVILEGLWVQLDPPHPSGLVRPFGHHRQTPPVEDKK